MASLWLDELNLGIPAIHDMLPGLLSRVLKSRDSLLVATWDVSRRKKRAWPAGNTQER